jgi:hypothetical protein
MRARQLCSGSSLNDSPLTGEIAPPSEAGEATRLNPLVHRQAASRLTDRGVVGHVHDVSAGSAGLGLIWHALPPRAREMAGGIRRRGLLIDLYGLPTGTQASRRRFGLLTCAKV